MDSQMIEDDANEIAFPSDKSAGLMAGNGQAEERQNTCVCINRNERRKMNQLNRFTLHGMVKRPLLSHISLNSVSLRLRHSSNCERTLISSRQIFIYLLLFDVKQRIDTFFFAALMRQMIIMQCNETQIHDVHRIWTNQKEEKRSPMRRSSVAGEHQIRSSRMSARMIQFSDRWSDKDLHRFVATLWFR